MALLRTYKKYSVNGTSTETVTYINGLYGKLHRLTGPSFIYRKIFSSGNDSLYTISWSNEGIERRKINFEIINGHIAWYTVVWGRGYYLGNYSNRWGNSYIDSNAAPIDVFNGYFLKVIDHINNELAHTDTMQELKITILCSYNKNTQLDRLPGANEESQVMKILLEYICGKTCKNYYIQRKNIPLDPREN